MTMHCKQEAIVFTKTQSWRKLLHLRAKPYFARNTKFIASKNTLSRCRVYRMQRHGQACRWIQPSLTTLTCFWVDFEFPVAGFVYVGVYGEEETAISVLVGGWHCQDVSGRSSVLWNFHNILSLAKNWLIVVDVLDSYVNLQWSTMKWLHGVQTDTVIVFLHTFVGGGVLTKWLAAWHVQASSATVGPVSTWTGDHQVLTAWCTLSLHPYLRTGM